tara:strand:+ start:60 stop:323 length:264 start_codon:yes stop_codon:yes gene_type:complete
MSKKKSYMDKSNILSESKLFKLISKLAPFKSMIKKAFSSKKDKDVLKNPEVKKAISDFEKIYSNAMKNAEEAAREADAMVKKYGKDK